MEAKKKEKPDSSLLNINEENLTDIVIQLNEYRRSLSQTTQPKFILFILQIARDAQAKGDRTKAVLLTSLHDSLKAIYVYEK